MSSAAVVAAALRERQSFILTSHARPDGDAIGSQLALAFALDALGKSVRLINKDPVPGPYRAFPGTNRIELSERATVPADAVVLLECSELSRPEVAGLEQYFIINVDHHLGNEMYGAVNWFDASAAACGEMVGDIIDALGVAWTREIAANLYLAIATDTGSFRYGSISPRTFDKCRRIAEAGADPAALSRLIFDSYSVGRVRIMGTLLRAMELYHADRLAVLHVDDELLADAAATIDDTEGLVNLPLGAREVVSVVLFKRQSAGTYRVSLRSKGDLDVRAVAAKWSGGGHKNAAGCTVSGDYEKIKQAFVQEIGVKLKSLV
ncbi:MAG TPA: bifunctional oligoribonuclease/PAP phosphatase NrnA [Vicinamibacterales bacterium]|nr:bifunctional oligoribonuclease/PAP phosphatase NrnA [Vicinamibacterales bacterium]